MRDNAIRRIWGEGGAVVNGWCAIPSSFSAEIMARQGWDSLTLDLQHGVLDYSTAIPMLQAIATTPTVPLARVPWLEPGIIMKMLDAGCAGVICPMVNSREDAERLVFSVRYPPQGGRSFGPVRVGLLAGAEYWRWANEVVLAIAMIETRAALDNLDAILSTPGIDAVYIGPTDLSRSLGCTPKLDQDEAPVVEAIEHILARAKAHGVVAGIHNATPAYARRMIEKGFRLVTVSSDAQQILAGAASVIAAMRAGSRPVGATY